MAATSIETTSPGRRRRSDGERTHEAILEVATRLASIEGLEGLTIGRLAAALGVSKSGLYAHFGSREQLQLETIEAAQLVFGREVIAPLAHVPVGSARLRELSERYFSYLERWVFPGGCFFASLLAEQDGRDGPVRDVVRVNERDWMDLLTGMAAAAIEKGEVGARDPAQLAFELYACLEMTNYQFVLFRDAAFIERGRRAVDRLLEPPPALTRVRAARRGATPSRRRAGAGA